MRKLIFVGALLAVSLAAGLGMAGSPAFAHEGREVGEYRLVVGWLEEPTYEGYMNAMLVRVTRLPSGSPEAPVEGLQGSLLLEVTHVSSESSRVLNVRALPDEPGHYVADFIPTAAGVYQVRVFGAIEGTIVDETFISEGGGGDFDDVLSSAALQFPVELPETRELESAVRGAMQTAQQAQDAALMAEDASGTDLLVIVALVLAGVGSTTGVLGLYLALRRR